MDRVHHKLLGLTVSRYDMKTGEAMKFSFKAGRTQDNFAFHAMQAKGEAQVVRPDGTQGSVYSRGQTNADRAPLPVTGIYQLVATTVDCRHICVSSAKVGGRFRSQTIRAQPGDAVQVPKGAVLVLGDGSIKVGAKEISAFQMIVAQSADLDATALTECLGILAWPST